MRSFLEVLRFEVRYQFRSPFLWGALVVFFLIHFLTITSIGVHLDENERIDINGAAKIIQVVSTLTYLAMLPVTVFVITAITRDYEKSLASLFFVTPVGKLSFLLGRFGGAFVAALAVGLAGLLGTWIGTHMPWLDQGRIGEYSFAPYAFCLAVILVPNLFTMCALFFAVGTLTRSAAMIAAAAMAIMTADLVLALYTGLDTIGRAALADPFAALTIREATRYWTVPELNAQLPRGQLVENRLLWFGIASALLAYAFRQFRLDLEHADRRRWFLSRPQRNKLLPPPAPSHLHVETSSRCPDSLAQFASQLKMDIAGAWKSPFVYILLLLSVVTTIQEFHSHVDPLSGVQYYPLTSLMLGHFRGLLTPVLIVAIYYSGTLVYREQDSGLSEIVDASPYAQWIMVVSKTVTLCLIVFALLFAVMLTSIVSQATTGYTNFEIPVYLKSLFVHNGFYYAMLCVLAIVIQVLAANRWLGTLSVFCAFVALLSLEHMGVEHVLVSFKIPYAVYSDMNGYGPADPQVLALIAYWAPFCVLLMLVGHLLYPRGLHATLPQRVREAGTRFGRGLAFTSLVTTAAFVAAGGWIFYNTNILNPYQTTTEQQQLLAQYEMDYGRYDASPAPSFQKIDMQVDIYPHERRLVSRGSAVLRNNKDHAIHEFVVSLDPRMRVGRLAAGAAAVAQSDREQGFYLFTLDEPLEPGMTVRLDWSMAIENQGFVNSNHDYEIVENGTYHPGGSLFPVPGFNTERFIEDDAWRRRLGLDPAKGLPALGDPAYLGVLKLGVDSHCEFRAIVSTSADQIAITQGELRREWLEDGRRFFEYVADRPIWPAVSIASARYEVARDKWNDVALEIYHDRKHGRNIADLMRTVKLSLNYLTREFAPYPHATFKIVEHPLYHLAAHPPPGTADYPEVLGFLTDNSRFQGLDFATIHELSHQWWGVMAYGARMRGRQMLNETLAQYSTLLIFKEYLGSSFAGQVARSFQDGYLKARSAETNAERPLIETDDQAYISYLKGPLAFYALTDAIGEHRVNRALRNYLQKFADKGPPFPTSRDVVNELRAVAGNEHQELITDLFEKIVLYDFRIDRVEVRPSDGVFDVSITLAARKFEADGLGEETEVPLSAEVDIALFSQSDDRDRRQLPDHQEKRRVHTGIQTITVQVAKPPQAVEIDPHYKLIDRTRRDSFMKIDR